MVASDFFGQPQVKSYRSLEVALDTTSSPTIASMNKQEKEKYAETTLMSSDSFDLAYSNAKTVTRDSTNDLKSILEQNTMELRIGSR